MKDGFYIHMWQISLMVPCSHTFYCSISPPLNRYSNRLTVHVYAVAIIQQSAFTEASFFGLSESKSAQVVYRWPHLAWTSRQPTGNHCMTGWCDLACILWYVESKTAWIDIIYFLSQNPTHWLLSTPFYPYRITCGYRLPCEINYLKW